MTAASLDALRDIHLPPVPALASVPEIWMAAGALALAAAFFLGVRRFLKRRALTAALRDLARIAATHARDGDANRYARDVSQLVRRYAINRYPQHGVEGLVGIAWLAFLDAHGGNGEFAHGIGTVLESRPYQSHGELDAVALQALVCRWLKANP